MSFILPILIDASLKGLAILLLAVIITIAMRQSSAAARHLVWTAAVVAVLTMPVLSYLLPGLAVLPAPVAGEIAEVPAATESDPESIARSPGALASEPHAPALPSQQADRGGSPVTPDSPSHQPSDERTVEREAASAVTTPAADDAPSARPWWQAWLPWLPWAWLGGASFAMLPLVLGWLSLWHLRRTTQPITTSNGGSWQALLTKLAGKIGLTRPVMLLKSPCRTMPMTWGAWPWSKAKVLIPEDADDWSPQRRRAVLLHELAHIHRRDCLTQLLTQVACALYWFNPLIWLASHRMLIERERACDDLVLTHETKASDYAQHLLEIATGPQAGLFATHAGIAMARRSKLDGRLVAILDQHRNRRAMSRLGVVLTITLIGAVAVPVAMLQAEGTAGQTPEAPVPGAVSVHVGDFELEFLGLAPYDTTVDRLDELQWWTPSGRPLENAPYDMAAGLVVPEGMEGVGRFYAALRVAADAGDVGFQIVLEDGERLEPRGHVVRGGEGTVPDLQAFTLAASQDTRATSFRLGVASGVWQTDRTVDLAEFPSGHELTETDIAYVVSPPTVTSSGLLYVDISFTGASHQLRVVCLDDGAQLHEPAPKTRFTSYGSINRTRLFFPDLAVDEVHGLQVQFRPYRYVEFRNVSLQPGHETEVEVVAEPAAENESTEAASDDASGGPVFSPQAGREDAADGRRAMPDGEQAEGRDADDLAVAVLALDVDERDLDHVIQHDVNEITPGGNIRFALMTHQPNRTDAPIQSTRFRNSDMVEVDRMFDRDGRPLDYQSRHTGSYYNYRVTFNEAVQPGKTMSYGHTGTKSRLIERGPDGEFTYTMRHTPGGYGETRRIEVHRLPAGAELVEALDHVDVSEVGGRTVLRVDEMVPVGGSILVSYRYRMPGAPAEVPVLIVDVHNDRLRLRTEHGTEALLVHDEHVEMISPQGSIRLPRFQSRVGDYGLTVSDGQVQLHSPEGESTLDLHEGKVRLRSEGSEITGTQLRLDPTAGTIEADPDTKRDAAGAQGVDFDATAADAEQAQRIDRRIEELEAENEAVTLPDRDEQTSPVSRRSATDPASMLPILQARYTAMLQAVEHEDAERASRLLEQLITDVETLVDALAGTPAQPAIRSAVGLLEQVHQALEAGDLAQARMLLQELDMAGPQLAEFVRSARPAPSDGLAPEVAAPPDRAIVAATFTTIWTLLAALPEAIEAEDKDTALQLLATTEQEAQRLQQQLEGTPLAPMVGVALGQVGSIRTALEQENYEQAGHLAHILRNLARQGAQRFERLENERHVVPVPEDDVDEQRERGSRQDADAAAGDRRNIDGRSR